ncbi:MAG: aldolase [Phycisphaeraceae bacterium]|nr:aldolase [Phycisphaeraceae bacterium]
MIDEPPILKIRRHFPRPTAAQIEALRDTPTSFAVDAMDGHGAVDWRIKPLDANCACFVGTAITCHAGPSDNMAVKAAIDLSQPGDVIMVCAEQFTGAACTGDLLVGIMKNRGVTGYVTDGLVRDRDDIVDLGLPVFAMGTSPNSGVSSGPGTVGLPVVVGGVPVDAGDVILGNSDGVTVIPRTRIDEVTERLERIRELESDLLARVRGGLKEVPGTRALLESDRVQYVD